MAPRPWLPVLGLLLAAGLGAQGGGVARQGHPARVLDADGKPAADAAVTFVSAPRLGAEPGDDDVVRATTGADGRCRVELVPTRTYQAWASVVRGAEAFVSPLTLRRHGATVLQLERDAMAAAREVRIEGAAVWREHGPLRVQIVVEGGRHAAPELEVAGDGTIQVPALPRTAVHCRVFARDRLVWMTAPAPLGPPLRLPAPWLVPVRVVDTEGAGIAEATLARAVLGAACRDEVFPVAEQYDQWPLAFAGEDGCCDVLIARGADPRPALVATLELAASKPGFGSTGDAQWVDGRLQFVLARRDPSAARAWPAATCRMRLVAAAAGQRRLIVRPAAPADEAIDALSGPARHWPKWVYLGSEDVAWTPGPFTRRAVPMPLLLPTAALVEGVAAEVREPVPLRLQLLDPTGGPAAQVLVCVSPLEGLRFLDLEFAMRARTDDAGRVVLPCTAGSWMVACHRDDGVAAQRVEVARGLAPLELRLQPLGRVRVRATSAGGAPAAGVRFELAFRSQMAGGAPEDRFLHGLAQSITQWSLQQVRTGPDGRADLPVFERQQLEMLFRVVGEKAASAMPLVPGAELVEIVVK